MQQIKQVALDLTNACSKQCWFCYNHSRQTGDTLWKPEEVINFALDCHEHGVEAFSLGGGEPLEYDGLFQIIDAIKSRLYTTVTSNGWRLEDATFFNEFVKHLPDKVHISIHCPEDLQEVDRVIGTIKKLEKYDVKTGANLLVSTKNLSDAKQVLKKLNKNGIGSDRIIILPMKYNFSPTSEQIKELTGNIPFQAPSCLLQCKRPEHYCSVTWNKMVSPCSYSPAKVPLSELTYQALIMALDTVNFQSCWI